ncbi:MAG: metal-dependent phosphoesterase [Candidatus Altiarchaeales archaeon ex4484_2]|nr:MAG: metal-dependent phosphoesterase [Candidatus Altiarchaeales archaeon ex4484_2]
MSSKMKIDIHTHSTYSDGYNTPKEMVEYAMKIGLDGLAITDHNEIKGSLEALKYSTRDFTVVPGVEVSSHEGHILCLGIMENVDKYLPAAEVIDRVHDLGGIAIAAHPFDRLRSGVGDLIYELDFDAVELYNGHTLLSTRRLEKIAKEINKPVTGGSDAHIMDDIGCVYIKVGDDVLDSIKKGRIEIVSNISKLRIIKGFLKSRLGLL